jgi:hypothetical protein
MGAAQSKDKKTEDTKLQNEGQAIVQELLNNVDKTIYAQEQAKKAQEKAIEEALKKAREEQEKKEQAENIQKKRQEEQIINIKSSLADMYSNYGNAISSSESILDKQKTMGNIVSNEQARINKEQQNLEQILQTNTRTNDLKENARKRQNAYNYMLFVAVIILLICVILSFIKKTIPIIPEALFSFLYVVIIAVGVIYLSYLYYGIYTRDLLNFDELHFNYSPVSKDISSIKNTQAQSDGNLLGPIFNPNICIGENCCTESTVFDIGVGKCIIPCSPGYVNYQGNCIASAQCTGNNVVCGSSCIPNTQNCLVSEGFSGINNKKQAEPFSPSEFTDYQKI